MFSDAVLCASLRPFGWAGACVMLLCSLWKMMPTMRQRRRCSWMPFALLVPFLVAFRLHQWPEPLPRALGDQGRLHHLQLPGVPGGPAATAQDAPTPEEAGVPPAGASTGRGPGQGLSPHPDLCLSTWWLFSLLSTWRNVSIVSHTDVNHGNGSRKDKCSINGSE